MSLILDAMKKLDRERSAASAGKRDIAAEILKPGDPPRRSGLLPLAIALGVTASVAALVTVLVIGGPGTRKGDSPPTAPAASARQEAAAPHPSESVAVSGKTAPPQGSSMGAPPVASPPATQRVGTKGDGERTAGERATGREAASGKVPTRSEAGAALHPAVKISGIVWQEEPSQRKAMINGKVARVGDTVDGMRILEIHPSHVKLSFDGKSFKAGMFE